MGSADALDEYLGAVITGALRDIDVAPEITSDADNKLSRVDDAAAGEKAFPEDETCMYLVEKGVITVDDGVVTGL